MSHLPGSRGATAGGKKRCRGSVMLLKEGGSIAEIPWCSYRREAFLMSRVVATERGAVTEVTCCCCNRDEAFPRSHGAAARVSGVPDTMVLLQEESNDVIPQNREKPESHGAASKRGAGVPSVTGGLRATCP